MVFSSLPFLFLFLPAVLLVYYIPFVRKRQKFKNTFLLAASLGFYTWGEPLFVFMMIFSICVNWILVILMDRQTAQSSRKAYMLAAVVFDIALLFVFKYVSFITKNIGNLFSNDSFVVNIALPIGISFFTFQILSYVLDVYYRKTPVQKNIINIALYISLFPQLIAGPIVRYKTISKEIESRKETFDDFADGFARFTIGLGKKILIADYAGLIADNIFALNSPDSNTIGLSAASAWLGALAYTLQIHFDFSGYSDMAIGLGRMFGFHFLENFNYPYTAKSITDFWHRWHISLSTWFRDYVYIPLGGSHVKKSRLVFNLFVVWLLTGVWHGANWTFAAWGLFYFLLLLLERFTGFEKRLKVFSHIYALFFIVTGWVLFRSDTIASAYRYLCAMFGFGTAGLTDETFFLYFSNGKWILLIGMLLSTPVIPLLKNKIQDINKHFYNIVSSVCFLVIFFISILNCIDSTYSPFIYFNF